MYHYRVRAYVPNDNIRHLFGRGLPGSSDDGLPIVPPNRVFRPVT
jgi:hypothetical protein